MAGKMKDDLAPEIVTEKAIPVMDAPKDYYIITNLQSHPIQIDLRDGAPSISLGPRLVGKTIHISKPVSKKLVGPTVRAQAARKQIGLEECDAGGGK